MPSACHPWDQGAHERTLSSFRTALGEKVFADLWAEGRAMGLDRLVQYATSEAHAAPGSPESSSTSTH